MTRKEVYEILQEKAEMYEHPAFIADDPIQIPHEFKKKEDIEIAGFIAAVFAWGQRTTILKKSKDFIARMDNSPFDFILNHSSEDLLSFKGFVHRTFNEDDALGFVEALKNIYTHHGGLEAVFSSQASDAAKNIHQFKATFLESAHLPRTAKHIADPLKGSTAKRINMYLRWMVRSNERGVDLGLWKGVTPKDLMMPLDVHTARMGRMLKLLKRKQNDWASVVELTESLRKVDPDDPVRFDFALFGMGVNSDY